MTDSKPTRRFVLIPGLALIGVALFVLQITTLEHIKSILVANAAYTAHGLRMTELLGVVLRSLRPFDWLLVLIPPAVLLWLILSEWRGAVVSRDLHACLSSEKQSLALLAVLAAAALRYYLAPGEFALMDSIFHVSRVAATAESLSLGHWPDWSFRDYGGFTLLRFYGPLFFLVTGALARATGEIVWATKAVLLLAHAASAFAMYAWVRALRLSRGAALLAATAYILSFEHTHQILWSGSLPLGLVFLWIPALFLCLERTITADSLRWPAALAAVTAALILSHHGHAIFGLQFAGLYTGVRMLAGDVSGGGRRVLRVALGLGAGAVACAGFLIPFLVDGSSVYQPHEFPLLYPKLSLQYLRCILVWGNQWTDARGAYFGLSILALAVACGILSWRGGPTPQRRALRGLSLLAVVALSCAQLAGGRVGTWGLALLCPLAGGLLDTRAWRWPQRTVLALLALIVLDLGPTTIQSVYRTDRTFLVRGLRAASERVAPNRLILGYTKVAPRTSFFDYYSDERAGMLFPGGSYPQGAPRSLNAILSMFEALNTRTDSLSSPQKDLLCLWNVGGIVTVSRDRFLPPQVQGAPTDGGDPPIAWVPEASPVIWTDSLAIARDDTLETLQQTCYQLDKDPEGPRRAYLRRTRLWVRAMHLDRARHCAERVFLYGGPDASASGASPVSFAVATTPGVDLPGAQEAEARRDSIGAGAVEVVDHTVALREVRIRYRTPCSGFLRLAYSWNPRLAVLVDGHPVLPLRSLLGAVVIPTASGTHQIDLAPASVPLYHATAVGGVAASLILLALPILIRRRR
jgi:hypothetical protein